MVRVPFFWTVSKSNEKVEKYLVVFAFCVNQVIAAHSQKIGSNELHPTLSPDGSELAFMSNVDGDDEIFVMNLRNKKVRQLTFNEEEDGNPTWSPNGEYIAFHTKHDGAYNIVLIKLAGLDLYEITSDTLSQMSPGWSWDSKYIFYDTFIDGLWQIDRIAWETHSRETFLRGNGEYLTSTPYPTSNKMIFSYTDSPGNHDTALEIIMTDSVGARIKYLTNDSGGNSNASFSMDGTWMAYNSIQDGNWEIYLMNLLNRSLNRLTYNGAIDGQPVIDSQGDRIYFTSNRDSDFDIYEMNLVDKQLTNLTDEIGKMLLRRE